MGRQIFLDPPFLANLGWIDQKMPNWLICQTGQTGWYIPLVGILSPTFGTLKSRGAHIVSPSKWQWFFFSGLLLVRAKQGPILVKSVKSKIIILMMPLMLVKPLELFSGSSIFPLTLGLSTYHIECWFINPPIPSIIVSSGVPKIGYPLYILPLYLYSNCTIIVANTPNTSIIVGTLS